VIAYCGLEEPSRRGQVAPRGQAHVDDLAELVDCPVHVAPHADDLDVGLVHEPAVLHGATARPGGLDEQRREPLHPPVHAHVINRDATLGQQLLHIAVRETVTQVPAHRDHDHIRRKPEPSKARSWCWHSNTTMTHHPSLPGSSPPAMQQTPSGSQVHNPINIAAETQPICNNNLVPPAGLRSGMARKTGHEGCGSPGGAGIPSRRRRRHSRPGVGVQVVQP